MRRSEGEGRLEEEANAPAKKIKSCRTRHFKFPELSESRGGGGGGGTPVSGQSVDKRVVRTVLNRSEYLYAGPAFAPFLPLSSSSSPSSRFHFRQRYLLDYPVLINSSGFIFIFTTPRSR